MPVLDVVVAGDVATLVANVVDHDGELDRVTIEWGDGTSDTVTSGFPGIRLDHTYTGDGVFTIVLEARTASGQSVIATTEASIIAFAAAVEASGASRDGDAGGSGSGSGGSGSSGGSGGGSTPPAPAPAPEPAPEELEPEPVPEPVTLDLLDSDVVIDVGGRQPTGTGASAEGEQRPFGFGIRSYAWHGRNGSSRAEGKLERVVDARSVLADMPDHVSSVAAEVSYTLGARAEVKGPWDRSSSFVVIVDDLRGSGGGTTLVAVTAENDDENPIERTGPGQHTGTLTTTLTRDAPGAAFVARGRCTSTSGSQVLAYFNEGYCDALEKGGVELRALSVTFIPIVEE